MFSKNLLWSAILITFERNAYEKILQIILWQDKKRQTVTRLRQDCSKPLLKTQSWEYSTACQREIQCWDLARINMRFMIDVNINLTW